MRLESPEFEDGDEMPDKVGYMQQNVNPELRVSGVPEEASSLVLIMDDPDAMEPAGKIWDHWVVYDIEASTNRIEPGESPGIEGVTDFRETGYNGPNPPDGEHTYLFKLYALDTELGLEEGKNKEEVEDAMEDHIIEKAELRGRYE
ncbi:MAG: YbhB/YbcL family Raf kinase inhibitor-like protein [Candidatus Nanohaloarchaea archaeon]